MNTKTDISGIVKLLKSRDFATAEALCRHGLAEEPDNPELKMCLGISRHLQGDKESFRKIHAELAPRMAKLARTGQVRKDVLAMWKNYNGIMLEYVVLGALVLGAGVATACVFGKPIVDHVREMITIATSVSLYAGPAYYEKRLGDTRQLYGGPEYTQLDPAGGTHDNRGE